jgi:hypothetical protein
MMPPAWPPTSRPKPTGSPGCCAAARRRPRWAGRRRWSRPTTGPAGSAVVKLATSAGGGDRAWATSDHDHHWNAWRREALAYRSGFAAGVYADAGLGAPRLLAAVEPRPGVVALWLEDVAGRPGPRRGRGLAPL